MILAVDAGNSNIIFGMIEDGNVETVVRIHTELNDTAEEYGIKIRQLLDYAHVPRDGFEGAILSSVVPPVTGPLRMAIRELTGLDCMLVGPGLRTGMNVRIDDPATLASDLAVGGVAALKLYGGPVIILDFGTATSMTVVDEKGSYRGGAIMPGVRLGVQALSAGTSLLPDISFTPPKRVIGTNTADAMRSGAVYATASMIDGMIERMEAELGTACKVVATGTLAPVITPLCHREILCDENLILKGLWTIWERNRR